MTDEQGPGVAGAGIEFDSEWLVEMSRNLSAGAFRFNLSAMAQAGRSGGVVPAGSTPTGPEVRELIEAGLWKPKRGGGYYIVGYGIRWRRYGDEAGR